MDISESLANVVFTRTPKGVSACIASSKELPRQLKSLLLLVDGQSPVSKFIPFLTNLLPLSDKFTELELAGYIQRNHAEIKPLLIEQVAALSIRSSLLVSQMGETDKVDPIVSNVLREIENFLAINAGVEALEIITVLSNIKTIDHLKAELPAYLDMIENYDLDASSKHALMLENLLLGE